MIDRLALNLPYNRTTFCRWRDGNNKPQFRDFTRSYNKTSWRWMNGYPAPAPRPVWVQSNWIVSLLLTRRKITRKKSLANWFYLYLMFFRDTWYWKSSELRLSEARGDIIGGLQKHKLRFTDTYLAASWSYLLLNISALFITVHNIHIIHNTQHIYFNSNYFIMPFYSTISALIPFCSSWRINK